MKYVKREKNSDLIAALHSSPLDTSSFILIAVRLIERSVPAHEMNLVRQIQRQYLIQDYHGAINGILSFGQPLSEEYQQLLKKVSKNLTDDPVNNESRRFYETAYAEKLESDIKKENNFTVFQELANTYIGIVKKQNITISHNLNSIEDILSRVFKLNDSIELGLKQKSDSYQKKDRDRKEYGNVITKNPGIIKSVSPNFSDNLLTQKKEISKIMLDKKIEPGYSKTNKNIPFVASISGTAFTLVALLVQYINEHQRDVNLEVKVNRIIDLFISQYIGSGYHSYGEIVSVLNEPHIQSIFKEATIRLNYGVIDAEQAFHRAQDYAIGLALRANLHAEIRNRPKTEAHVYPVEPLSYGIHRTYASKPGHHYFQFKNVKEMKMAVNRLNEIGIHLVESGGTNYKECSDLIYRNAFQELTIEVTGNALDLIRKTIAASDKKEQKQSSAEPRAMLNNGQQDLRLLVTPPEAANSSQNSSLAVESKASKVLTLNDLMNPSIFYPYGREKSRTHFFEAVSSKNSTLKGDCLKRAILTQFKKSLDNVTNAEALQDTISAFRKSEEYTILATGQGIFTRFFHLKTDSIKAFGTICREAESYIEKIKYPQ